MKISGDLINNFVKEDVPYVVKEAKSAVEKIVKSDYSNPFAILGNPAHEASSLMKITKDVEAGFKL